MAGKPLSEIVEPTTVTDPVFWVSTPAPPVEVDEGGGAVEQVFYGKAQGFAECQQAVFRRKWRVVIFN